MGHRPKDLQKLFRDHAIRPFNQRHEYRRITKLRPIIIQIRFSHTPRSGARTTSIDLNMLSRHLIQRLAQGRPSDRSNRVSERLSHQPNRLSQQENLHLVSSLASANPCRNGNAALVGSSEPHALFITILSGLCAACPSRELPVKAKGRAANCANRDRNSLRIMSFSLGGRILRRALHISILKM